MRVVWVLAVLQMAALQPIRAEVFSAMVDMEALLNTEKELVDFLNNYIRQEEVVLRWLRLYLEMYKKQWMEASRDIQKYLHNPVNAFLMIKRLASDWKEIEKLLYSSAQYVSQFMQRKVLLTFPDDQDLTGSVAAVCRLQDTYNLDTSAIARGEIQGSVIASELKSGDCFEIGRQAFIYNDHYHAMLWLQEALDRVEKEKNATVAVVDILEYLAYSTFMNGNLRHALKLTNDILKLAPHHSGANTNRPFYEEAIAKAEAQNRAGTGDVILDDSTSPKKPVEAYPGKELYEMLCRGEKPENSVRHGQLYCRYFTNNRPFYLLQPFMIEEVAKYPYIVLYHDLMFEKEIELIKEISAPKLNRAGVYNNQTGKTEPAYYRISKSAWLRSKDHLVVAKLDRRLEAATNLAMETAEHLQVGNYGIGGHYEPHFDFITASSEEFKELAVGNRIATALFYFNDVDAGGATVFPEAGIAVQPKKGSAVFWYNLLPNGDVDFLTRHAACPVLAGTKWVANKWIHERGQEFRRPCRLKMMDW